MTDRKRPVRITGLVASTTNSQGVTPVFQLNGNRANTTVSGSASAGTPVPVRSDDAAITCDLVLFSATTDCWLRFGGAGVAATADSNSLLLPRGVQPVVVPLDSAGVPFAYFSVLQVTAGGSSQLEGIE